MAVKKQPNHWIAMIRSEKRLDGKRVEGALRAFRQQLRGFIPRNTRPDAIANIGKYNPITVSLFGPFVLIDRPNKNVLWECTNGTVAESMFASIVRHFVTKQD